MNLLLLLSALLSALAGIGGTRGGAAPSAVCERSVEAQVVRAAALPAAMRPMQALPGLAAVRQRVGGTALVLAAEPLFASRRRE